MKTIKFSDEQSWLDARRGRITGTRLKDLIVKRGGGYKIGFYEIIAERIAIPPSEENVMDRGHRLEIDALAKFAAETGKEADGSLLMWTRDDNDDIAISPDGVIGETEAVECKCLSSARHIEAYLTREIPDEYREQVLQYFIVNDKLKTLYFVFYDPRMPKDFFYLAFGRNDIWEEVKIKDEVKIYTIQDKVDEYLELERQTLGRIDEIVAQLTF